MAMQAATWRRTLLILMGTPLLFVASAQSQDVEEPATPDTASVTEESVPATEALSPAATVQDAFTQEATPVETAPENEESNVPEAIEMTPIPDTIEIVDLKEVEFDDSKQWESTPKPFAGEDLTGELQIETITEPSAEYRYAAYGRPNPFLPPVLEEIAVMTGAEPPPTTEKKEGKVVVAGTEIPVVSPLQQYPLQRLEVKGIWRLENGEWRAIIMTPEKEGVIVKTNDPIAAGKILEIHDDHINVRQYSLRADGAREFKDSRMNLGDAREERKKVVKLVPGKGAVFSPPENKPDVAADAEEETEEVPAGQTPPAGKEEAQKAGGEKPGNAVNGAAPPAGPIPLPANVAPGTILPATPAEAPGAM